MRIREQVGDPMRSVSLSVRLPAELDAWVRKEAARRHVTVADVIREVLWAELDRKSA